MQQWFDRKTPVLIYASKKLILKFKKSKLHIDEEIYKKVKNPVQNLIRKKTESYETNLWQKINKPTKHWKTLKLMDLPFKVAASNICLKGKNESVWCNKKLLHLKKKFQVLHKIWYLSYLLLLIFLLNLKFHATMAITQCQKMWFFNIKRCLL